MPTLIIHYHGISRETQILIICGRREFILVISQGISDLRYLQCSLYLC